MELDFNKIIRLKKIRIEKSELSEEVFITIEQPKLIRNIRV